MSKKEITFDEQAILIKWFDDNIDYPYPSYEQKNELHKLTGLSLKQVITWFTNRRRRNKVKSTSHKVVITKAKRIILKEWFNDNIHEPYPSDEQKKELCQKTELSCVQIDNWFSNQRSRTIKNGNKSSGIQKGKRMRKGNKIENEKKKEVFSFLDNIDLLIHAHEILTMREINKLN